jgi:hypothetical protein
VAAAPLKPRKFYDSKIILALQTSACFQDVSLMAKRFSGWLGCRLAKRWAAFGIMAFGKIEQRMQHWQAKVDSHPLPKREAELLKSGWSAG